MTDPEAPETVEISARRARRRSPSTLPLTPFDSKLILIRQTTESCEQCRKRKLRCDRGLPCRPCKRSRGALQCSYSPETKRAASVEAPRLSSQHASNPETTPDVGSILDAMKGGKARFCTTVYQPPETADLAKKNQPTDLFPRPHVRVGTLETEKTRLFGRSHWVHALAHVSSYSHLAHH